MTELAKITLENEMDLTLAYKRSMSIAAMLGLTLSTQTAFATAVSEVCREIIDKATQGVAILGTTSDSGRFFITAAIDAEVDSDFNRRSEGFEYARKLLPMVELSVSGTNLKIVLQLGIPRSNRLDQHKILSIRQQILANGPVSAYEEVKQRNATLVDLNQRSEFALEEAQLINQQKNEFLSVASHELNSPLTILRSYAQIALKMNADPNSKVAGYLGKIENQTNKLVKLVRQLMDISKFEHGDFSYDFQPVSINPFLQSSMESLSLLVDKHYLSLHLNADTDAKVMIDLMRLEQVLSNLVGNAAKYSSEGSAIKITLELSKDYLRIAVTDQGIGMTEESQKMVFDKFYRDNQIKKKYSGLGMGLYISSRIIQDHQGSLQVSSEIGKGSTFSFDLPVIAMI
ncbi:HAMP domain-containing sensor histidine kinase [Pedobacter sp. MC2016-15]|uniref:sensor histidine kinase n=1 Tax=Pedobacter sp. MC2016-15 TaxID=2994473 RepID=UPI002245AFC8|nr:HAMP domain-containing sensor histidine kinase [Pedobacter sp. MC2016-15]MCX2480838.1 HAMP domain-containing sensor histidine kinase [Pedobacter sp. MC2016-15]